MEWHAVATCRHCQPDAGLSCDGPIGTCEHSPVLARMKGLEGAFKVLIARAACIADYIAPAPGEERPNRWPCRESLSFSFQKEGSARVFRRH